MKNVYALLLSALLFATSCGDNSNSPEDVIPGVAKKPLKALIVSGWHQSTKPQMDLINFEGDSLYRSNIFEYINGSALEGTVNAITVDGNYIYMACSDKNMLYVLDKETFKKVNSISFGNDFSPSKVTILTDGRAVVTGTFVVTSWDVSTGETIYIVTNPTSPSHTIEKVYVDDSSDVIETKEVKQVGDKLFVEIPSYSKWLGGYDFENVPAQIFCYDIDNIATGKHRVVAEGFTLASTNDNFITDAKGTIWVIGEEQGTTTLAKLNANEETLSDKVQLNSISGVYLTGFALSFKGDELYVRSQKSIYAISTNNPTDPFEPIAAINGNITGSSQFFDISGLMVDTNGKVQVLTTISGSSEKGYMFEFTPSEDGSSWGEPVVHFDIVPHGKFMVDVR